MNITQFAQRIKKAYSFQTDIERITVDYKEQTVKVYRRGKVLPRVYRLSIINKSGGLKQKYRAWAMTNYMLVIGGDAGAHMAQYSGIMNDDNVVMLEDFKTLTNHQIINPR
ncbi:hypothetical protein EHFPEHOM_00018 [Vibrio phage vB_Vc_SrVc9]|uniref:Uncharacterized protein n=2 Tax=Maculvirus TaxID=2731958 RepID=A0A7T7K856_9CAUD|nr:hypothetical protein vBVcSrVc2_00018 [Vibrio phage vB_Vc_SrVc2]CAB3563589.1 hypothetical protein EHFPEHOM_00018 [Vibrio phage vB_Vc_SrVc9]